MKRSNIVWAREINGRRSTPIDFASLYAVDQILLIFRIEISKPCYSPRDWDFVRVCTRQATHRLRPPRPLLPLVKEDKSEILKSTYLLMIIHLKTHGAEKKKTTLLPINGELPTNSGGAG